MLLKSIFFIIFLFSYIFSLAQVSESKYYLVYTHEIHMFHGVSNEPFEYDSLVGLEGIMEIRKNNAIFRQLYSFDPRTPKHAEKDVKWRFRKEFDNVLFTRKDSTFLGKLVIEKIEPEDFNNFGIDVFLVPIMVSEIPFSTNGVWTWSDNSNPLKEIYNFDFHENQYSYTYENGIYSKSFENIPYLISIAWKKLNLIHLYLPEAILHVKEKIDSSNYKFEVIPTFIASNMTIKNIRTLNRQKDLKLDSVADYFLGNWTSKKAEIYEVENGVPIKTSDSLSYEINFIKFPENKFNLRVIEKSKIIEVVGTWEVGKTGRYITMKPSNESSKWFTYSLFDANSDSFSFTRSPFSDRPIFTFHLVGLIKNRP